jgi:hypothetical protein
MGIKTRFQIGFIKQTMHLMKKEQLLGIYGILILYPDTDEQKKEIMVSLKNEWIKRGYDIKELIEEKN